MQQVPFFDIQTVAQDELAKYFEKVQAAQLIQQELIYCLCTPDILYLNLTPGDIFSETGGAMRRQWLTT